MRNTYQSPYNKAVREQRIRGREVQPANVFPQSFVQKSGQNSKTGVNKGYPQYEGKVKPRQEKEIPEREMNQNIQNLQEQIANKQKDINSYNKNLPRTFNTTQKRTSEQRIKKEEQELTYLKQQSQLVERTPTKQDKQNVQSQKEPNNEVDDPMISKLKEKIQQLVNKIKVLTDLLPITKNNARKEKYTNQIQLYQKEKEQSEQQLKKYISEKEKKKTSSNFNDIEKQPKQLNQNKLDTKEKQNVLSSNKTNQPYNQISNMENTKPQQQLLNESNQYLKDSRKQSDKTINQKYIPINEDKPKQQPFDELKVQKLFTNERPTETPNKHSSNIHKHSSKKIQKFEYEDNKNHQLQAAEEINEDDQDKDLVNNEEFITDKQKYNPVFSYEYNESSQKLLVNIFLPGDSENTKIKDYKIMESETDEPKMECFIKGTYECDENTEVFKDGDFILRFDLPESITNKSKEQKLNGKVRDQKGNDTGFYEVEFLF